MPKRFEPNRRLLQILVGSNLYGSSDACVRELIQNSWDAIQLRKSTGDGKGGAIELRYSESARWFEVVDDGIGMDLSTIENSFLEIGQDKLKVLDGGTRQTQIGYFGIGILSIFLVADRFEVATRLLDSDGDGIRFTILGIDGEMTFVDEPYPEVGTCIRVFIRPNAPFELSSIPEYMSTYARHVGGITIHSVDDDTIVSLKQTWVTDGIENVRDGYRVPGLVSSRFALSPALRAHAGVLSNEITICNAGFLAENAVHDLLPLSTMGLVGEVDLEPNTLTMGMSRERIQRDENWNKLGEALQEVFVKLALDELSGGVLQNDNADNEQEIRRTLLLWYKHLPEGAPFDQLYAVIEERVFRSLTFVVHGRSPTTLANLLNEERNREKLYFRDVSRNAQRTEHIDDEGLPIQVSQEIRDSIRVGALRARGFDVIELGSITVNIRNGNAIQTHQVFEEELVTKCLLSHGGRLINIINAEETDMDLESIERLPILKDALSMDVGFRFASVPDSLRRVIADSTGKKYINIRNADVQDMLEVIPAAIANPLRSKLLEAYLQLELFQLRSARQIILELLAEKELATLAKADTAPFTRRRLEELIRTLRREFVE